MGVTSPETVWVTAMPEELDDVIRHLDGGRSRAATRGWIAIGAAGRQRYREFIDSAAFSWVRRLRCELTARQLVRAGS